MMDTVQLDNKDCDIGCADNDTASHLKSAISRKHVI
jgi:hypothetical protein